MSGRRSRSKGANGEREVAQILRGRGFEATRNRVGVTAQDLLHNIAGVHIEVKRQEKLQIPMWLRQAEGDCPADSIPVLVYRKSNEPWRVVIPLSHYLDLHTQLRGETTTDDSSD